MEIYNDTKEYFNESIEISNCIISYHLYIQSRNLLWMQDRDPRLFVISYTLHTILNSTVYTQYNILQSTYSIQYTFILRVIKVQYTLKLQKTIHCWRIDRAIIIGPRKDFTRYLTNKHVFHCLKPIFPRIFNERFV